jgi:hypothetical protein
MPIPMIQITFPPFRAKSVHLSVNLPTVVWIPRASTSKRARRIWRPLWRVWKIGSSFSIHHSLFCNRSLLILQLTIREDPLLRQFPRASTGKASTRWPSRDVLARVAERAFMTASLVASITATKSINRWILTFEQVPFPAHFAVHPYSFRGAGCACMLDRADLLVRMCSRMLSHSFSHIELSCWSSFVIVRESRYSLECASQRRNGNCAGSRSFTLDA